jgi:predicted membrane channel-forming protein YqfA (hemolysin III family)
MKAIPVVTIMTPVFVVLVIYQIRYHCCVQHRLEPLDVCVDIFVILGEMGVIWLTSILEAKALWASVR